MIRSAILALACTCLAVLAPGTAGAAWDAPVTVSGAGSSTSQTRIAGGVDGASWVVWKRELGGFDVIQGTTVVPDGTQGPIVTLSAPNMDATDPVIASRADGSVMVAWLNVSAVDDTVHSRSIAADGTLGAIQTRSAPGPVGQPAEDIALALGTDGTAGIAWRKFNGSSWVLQAVKVAADDSSGAIQDLSDPSSSVSDLDIGAAPPPASNPTAATGYGVVWVGGTGADGNVFGCQINPDGSLSGVFQALWPYVNPNFPAPGQPDGIGTGGDPRDIRIAYERGGSTNIMWIRNRTSWQVNEVPDNLIDTRVTPPIRARPAGDPDDTPYTHQAVERIRLAAAGGNAPPFPAPGTWPAPAAATPTVQGQPYEISSFSLSTPFNGWPVMAWVRDLDGGGSRILTQRILLGGNIHAWADPAGVSTDIYERPVIAANTAAAAVLSWGLPSVVPGQYNWQWSRFSSSSASIGFNPTDIYSMDTGSVVAESGNTIAAYTGVDAGFTGSSRIVTFTAPGIRVNPSDHYFGNIRIGTKSTVSIQIRGSGETASQVTGVTLSGPDASQFTLADPSECFKTLSSGENCQVNVAFEPQSAGPKNAIVTVNTEVGAFVTNLLGSGLDQTRNRITATPRNAAVRKGRVVRIRVNAANLGGVASTSTRVCVNLNKRALKLSGNRCRSIGSLPSGASRNLDFRVRVTWRVRRGARLPVTFRMLSGNAVQRRVVVGLRRKGN